jgi:phosphonate transport system permease protein
MTAPNRPAYLIAKGFINLVRTVPDLFWAMIFVTSVGAGAFAGALALIFFSLAIMAKLLSETVDAVDPRPLEAARATGARHFPAVRAAVLLGLAQLRRLRPTPSNSTSGRRWSWECRSGRH